MLNFIATRGRWGIYGLESMSSLDRIPLASSYDTILRKRAYMSISLAQIIFSNEIL
jgi:hypothetical protein